jgi:HlyD family secretion protein
MMRGIGLLLVGAALGAVVAVGSLIGSGATRGWGSISQSPIRRLEFASALRPSKITALGTLEPRVGPILVGSPLAGTRITKILVEEGVTVAAGDPLVELDRSAIEKELEVAQKQRDDASQRQRSEMTLANQRIAAAENAVDQIKQTREPELEAQRGRYNLSEVKVAQAEKDLQRLKHLHEGPDPLASSQQLEQQQLLLDVSKSERDAQKVALQQLELNLKFQAQKADAELAAARESKAIAENKAAIELLDRRVALAQLKLDETIVKAPTKGTVIRLAAHAGELVATQPLVQLADLDDMVCSAEVDVADLNHLPLPTKEGKGGDARAIVTSRAFGGKTLSAGPILNVRNLVGSAMLRPVDPRKTVDRSVAIVTLAINGKDARELVGAGTPDAAVALVGLQVDVTFEPSAK